jgi:uncharacterized protein (DUF58 family)
MAMGPATSEIPNKSLFARIWTFWQTRRRRARVRALSTVRFRLTREGVHYIGILLFIFVGALLRDINLLILLAGAMIGLLLLQWRFNVRTLIGLSALRSLPRHTFVGQSTEVTVQVKNPKRWLGSWLILVQDPLQKVLPTLQRLSEKGQTVIDEVRPASTSTSQYKLVFHQRGKYEVGPSTISTRFPLGLGKGSRTLDNAGQITVYPRLGSLTPRIQHLFQQEMHGNAQVSRKVGMHEADFYGLRPWSTGDSKRWIHWRTTARLGELSVRQFERQQRRQACILLDLFSVEPRSQIPNDQVELAIAFVATLASATARWGSDRLAVAVAGSESFALPSVQSSVLVENLLERLAIAAPSGQPKLAAALQGLSLPLMNNPYLLVVSTRANQSASLAQGLQDRVLGKLYNRLQVKWLDVSRGDLEPYFTWI